MKRILSIVKPRQLVSPRGRGGGRRGGTCNKRRREGERWDGGRGERNANPLTPLSAQILIHGPPEATNHLREFALSSLGVAKGKLFTPRVGDCVDASTETHIYQVWRTCYRDTIYMYMYSVHMYIHVTL